jgi:hypothetical protein
LRASFLVDEMLLGAMTELLRTLSNGPPSDAAIRAAVSACLRLVSESVGRAKVQLDASRGFEVFDAAGSKRPSLDLFLSSWRQFRTGVPLVGGDEFVQAIVAGHIARLGTLIGGRDISTIRVDVARLPRDVPRRPGRTSIGLLDVAAAVGGAPLRYLLEFFALKPTIRTLHQAVASGDNESIHMIWGRIPREVAAKCRCELGKTAEFHFVGW